MKIRFFEVERNNLRLREPIRHIGVTVPEDIPLGKALTPLWRMWQAQSVDDVYGDFAVWQWKGAYVKAWRDLKDVYGLTPLKLDLELKARGVSEAWRHKTGFNHFLGMYE